MEKFTGANKTAKVIVVANSLSDLSNKSREKKSEDTIQKKPHDQARKIAGSSVAKIDHDEGKAKAELGKGTVNLKRMGESVGYRIDRCDLLLDTVENKGQANSVLAKGTDKLAKKMPETAGGRIDRSDNLLLDKIESKGQAKSVLAKGTDILAKKGETADFEFGLRWGSQFEFESNAFASATLKPLTTDTHGQEHKSAANDVHSKVLQGDVDLSQKSAIKHKSAEPLIENDRRAVRLVYCDGKGKELSHNDINLFGYLSFWTFAKACEDELHYMPKMKYAMRFDGEKKTLDFMGKAEWRAFRPGVIYLYPP